MANVFTMPGSNNGYVPRLHQELMVEYSLNPKDFPIARVFDYRKFDEMLGYYIFMENDSQARIVSPYDFAFPDGNDRPQMTYGQDGFSFKPYACERTQVSRKYGFLAVQQTVWDLLDQGARFGAQQLMTLRA